MPIEITMPKLSDTMTDGTLVKWLKKENETVSPGDVLAEVETDKATQELEAFEAGTIARIVAPEGGKVPVGALIVVLAKPGEDAATVARGVSQAAAQPKPPAGDSAAPAAKQEASTGRGAAAAGNVEEGQEQPQQESPRPVEGGGAGSAVGAAAPAAPTGGARQRVSPLARKIAEEKGVALAGLVGTGPDGRVIKRDVLQAAARPQRQPPAAAPRGGTSAAPQPVPGLEQKTIPLSNIRQTIARRLLQSKQTVPHFYVSIDVEMDNLLATRKTANEQLAPEKLSVTDFVARAAAAAIVRVPAINASFTDTAIIRHGTINLGIAVAIEDGLVVPVIRDAQNLGLRQISTEIRRIAELARQRKLKAEQMSGSTFTISNLGMYGVHDFMAIINPPEAAILAVGGTEERPVVRNGQVVPGHVMTLTLSADHRVVDGAVGASFLSTLKKLLENPLLMLI